MRNKQIIRAIALVMGITSYFAAANKANALPQYDVVTTCYSDPELSNPIGYIRLQCNGHVQRSGYCNGDPYYEQEIGDPCVPDVDGYNICWTVYTVDGIRLPYTCPGQ